MVSIPRPEGWTVAAHDAGGQVAHFAACALRSPAQTYQNSHRAASKNAGVGRGARQLQLHRFYGVGARPL